MLSLSVHCVCIEGVCEKIFSNNFVLAIQLQWQRVRNVRGIQCW